MRAIEHDVLPTCQRYGMGVIPYTRLPADDCQDATASRGRTAPASVVRPAAWFDMGDPANQRKFDAVEQPAQLAEDTGITLIELALAFVLRHPAVTAPIIGPRTMEHLKSHLAAADIVLADDILDRIDQINPPAVTINPADNGWTQPSLAPVQRRR